MSRMAAQEQLRESEQHYRELFDEHPHPMWVYDLETLVFLAFNQAAVMHYGYGRDELLGMTILDIRPPEDREALLASIRSVRPTVQRAAVWRHRRRDGSRASRPGPAARPCTGASSS